MQRVGQTLTPSTFYFCHFKYCSLLADSPAYFPSFSLSLDTKKKTFWPLEMRGELCERKCPRNTISRRLILNRKKIAKQIDQMKGSKWAQRKLSAQNPLFLTYGKKINRSRCSDDPCLLLLSIFYFWGESSMSWVRACGQVESILFLKNDICSAICETAIGSRRNKQKIVVA